MSDKTAAEIELVLRKLSEHSRIAVFTRKLLRDNDALQSRIERYEKALKDISASQTACRDKPSKLHCRDIATKALSEGGEK